MMAARRRNIPAKLAPPQPGTAPVRRWLRFGPSLVLALLALGLLWPSLRLGLPGNRPRLDRPVGTSIPTPTAAPELAWVLEQRNTLGLSEEQAAKVRRLQVRWADETRELREALQRESVALDQELESRPRSGLNIREFQARAAPLAELSRRLAVGRRTAWTEAASVLTPRQRQQVEAAWNRHWSSRSTDPSP